MNVLPPSPQQPTTRSSDQTYHVNSPNIGTRRRHSEPLDLDTVSATVTPFSLPEDPPHFGLHSLLNAAAVSNHLLRRSPTAHTFPNPREPVKTTLWGKSLAHPHGIIFPIVTARAFFFIGFNIVLNIQSIIGIFGPIVPTPILYSLFCLSAGGTLWSNLFSRTGVLGTPSRGLLPQMSVKQTLWHYAIQTHPFIKFYEALKDQAYMFPAWSSAQDICILYLPYPHARDFFPEAARDTFHDMLTLVQEECGKFQIIDNRLKLYELTGNRDKRFVILARDPDSLPPDILLPEISTHNVTWHFFSPHTWNTRIQKQFQYSRHAGMRAMLLAVSERTLAFSAHILPSLIIFGSALTPMAAVSGVDDWPTASRIPFFFLIIAMSLLGRVFINDELKNRLIYKDLHCLAERTAHGTLCAPSVNHMFHQREFWISAFFGIPAAVYNASYAMRYTASTLAGMLTELNENLLLPLSGGCVQFPIVPALCEMLTWSVLATSLFITWSANFIPFMKTLRDLFNQKGESASIRQEYPRLWLSFIITSSIDSFFFGVNALFVVLFTLNAFSHGELSSPTKWSIGLFIALCIFLQGGMFWALFNGTTRLRDAMLTLKLIRKQATHAAQEIEASLRASIPSLHTRPSLTNASLIQPLSNRGSTCHSSRPAPPFFEPEQQDALSSYRNYRAPGLSIDSTVNSTDTPLMQYWTIRPPYTDYDHHDTFPSLEDDTTTYCTRTPSPPTLEEEPTPWT